MGKVNAAGRRVMGCVLMWVYERDVQRTAELGVKPAFDHPKTVTPSQSVRVRPFMGLGGGRT